VTAAIVRDAEPPFGTIVFDCDSTLSAIEGVDELCGLVGVDLARVADLTRRAMAGELALEAVYGERLDLLRPDAPTLEALGRKYVDARLPHVVELCAALRDLGKRLFIVSGGLRQAVLALAERLGIPESNVYAVEAFLDRDGAYAGFDDLSPLARSGGKLDVLREIASADHGGGVALIGDGVTDLEAAPAVRRFIAFGGVVRREPVFRAAAVCCESGDAAALLPLLTDAAERERLARRSEHALLLGAARGATAHP